MAVNWNKLASKLNQIIMSASSRKDRIIEQHTNILELDVDLSDDPLIPTTKEMVERYAIQEAKKEIIKLCTEALEDG